MRQLQLQDQDQRESTSEEAMDEDQRESTSDEAMDEEVLAEAQPGQSTTPCPCGRPDSTEEMIACDSSKCKTYDRWYHYDCVGIDEVPEIWVYPSCSEMTEVEDNDVDDSDDDDVRYCKCQKTKKESIGFDTRWIGCDNGNCQYERFHYRCVGLTETPNYDWICPKCQAQPSTSAGS